MTNLQSLAGGMVWSAVAALLMLVTFEPVAVAKTDAEAKIAHKDAGAAKAARF